MSRLAFASASLLAYTYVGYPIVVAALAKLRPLEVTPDPAYEPRVSVLIPAYNAKSYVRPKIESLLAQAYPKEKLEILVYSDASTDGTDDEIRAFEGRGVRLIRGEKRAGKPTALNVMRKEAKGDVLVLTDIRQTLSANAVRSLVTVLADPTVGCVSGNLELVGGSGAGAYWRYENFIRACEARFRGMVGVTGPLYAIRREDLGEVPKDIILDDMWIPFVLRLQGKKLVFEANDMIALGDAFDDDREGAQSADWRGRRRTRRRGRSRLSRTTPWRRSTRDPHVVEDDVLWRLHFESSRRIA